MFTYNVFLIGFMGTGKSTVASCFSRMYGAKIVEMDEMIADREGRSISDIFAAAGEEYFRDLETDFLRELQLQSNRIVSCGGGIVLRDQNVSLMKENGKVILLTASPEVILERVKDDNDRPLLRGRKNVSAICELMEMRKERYEKAADVVVNTDGKTAEEICIEIEKKIKKVKER